MIVTFIGLIWYGLFFDCNFVGCRPSGYEGDLPVSCTLVKSKVLTGILIPSGFLT